MGAGAGTGVRLLTTSQVPLGVDGEHVHAISPLPFADAVELFGQRAAVHDPDFVSLPRATAESRRLVGYHEPALMTLDDRGLVEAGWTLKHVRPVDMFPQTPHIECVALLERA